MRSAKQRLRMAAKARRRFYLKLRRHMDGPHESHLDFLYACTAYDMRRSLAVPLFNERPQWEPPPGRSRSGRRLNPGLPAV